jgi:hypothetical protein
MRKLIFVLILSWILLLILGCDVPADSGDSGDSGDAGDGGAEPIEPWDKAFDGEGYDDMAYDVAYDAENDILYVVGYVQPQNPEDLKWGVRKLRASDGHQEWFYDFNGPTDKDDTARAVDFDDTGIYVVGSLCRPEDTSVTYNMAIKKLDFNGQVQWEFDYDDGGMLEFGKDVVVDKENGVVYVIGDGWGGYPGDGGTSTEWWIKALSTSNGSELWEKKIDAGGTGYADSAYAGVVDTSMNALFVGGKGQTGTGSDYNNESFILKLDTDNDGATIWSEKIIYPEGNFCYDICMDTDNIYATGIVLTTDGSDNDYDFMTACVSKAGDTLWAKVYEGLANEDDKAYAVAVDDANDAVYFGGHILHSQGSPYTDMWLLKLKTSDGTDYDASWAGGIVFDGSENVSDQINALEMANDAVFIAGYTNWGGTDSDWWVIAREK